MTSLLHELTDIYRFKISTETRNFLFHYTFAQDCESIIFLIDHGWLLSSGANL